MITVTVFIWNQTSKHQSISESRNSKSVHEFFVLPVMGMKACEHACRLILYMQGKMIETHVLYWLRSNAFLYLPLPRVSTLTLTPDSFEATRIWRGIPVYVFHMTIDRHLA